LCIYLSSELCELSKKIILLYDAISDVSECITYGFQHKMYFAHHEQMKYTIKLPLLQLQDTPKFWPGIQYETADISFW
jgi:hypothetical protein